MTELETREAILMAAIKLLGEKGFANVSMNDIVRESGVSKGGLYWHFKSKDEIIQAIFDYFLDAQLQLLTITLAEEGRASEKLRRIVQRGLGELEGNFPPPLEFYALAARDEALMKRMVHFYDTYRARVAELIQQGMDDGEFEPGDAELLAVSIVSFIEGIVLVGLSVSLQGNFETQFNNAIDLILRGLRRGTSEGE